MQSLKEIHRGYLELKPSHSHSPSLGMGPISQIIVVYLFACLLHCRADRFIFVVVFRSEQIVDLREAVGASSS